VRRHRHAATLRLREEEAGVVGLVSDGPEIDAWITLARRLGEATELASARAAGALEVAAP
jgi:hypothetical protein